MILKSSKKQIIGFIIAVASIAIFNIIPGSESGLSHAALGSLGLFIAAIVMWMTDVFPMSITAAFIACLYPILNIMEFKMVISNFATGGMLFIFGTFAITAAMRASTLPLRITNFAIKLSKGSSKKLILTFTLATGLVSSFMSSSATCVMFWMFANTLLKTMNADRNTSGLAPALAIACPVAAGVGGFITPAGTPGNVLLMNFLAQNGYELTFAQWTIIGLPLGLICLVVFALWAGFAFKPEKVTEEAAKAISDQVEAAGKLNSQEIKTIVIIAAMIICWFLGSWVPVLNTTVVAILGMAVMFMPGVKILDWSKMKDSANADLLLMMGLAPIITAALSSTGALEYIISGVFSGGAFANMNGFILILIVAIVVCVLRAFIPTPAACVALLGPLMITVATLTGANPMVLFMIVAFWSPAAMLLLYTEPIFYFSFGEGYYTEGDLLKGGAVPSLIMAVVCTLLLPMLVSVIGF